MAFITVPMFLFSKLQLIVLLLIYLYLGVVKIPIEVSAGFNDLLAHGAGYLVLMVSGLFAFPYRHLMWRLFLVFLAYSFFIECVQYFLSYRFFSWMDMLANTLGLLAGAGAGIFVLPLIKTLRIDSKD